MNTIEEKEQTPAQHAKSLLSELRENTILDPGTSNAPGVATYVPPAEPKQKIELPDDKAEELLARYMDNDRSLSALRLAEVKWRREVLALTEAKDGCSEEELDRLALAEAELGRVPAKLRLLERRANSIRRELQKEFGIRYYKLQQLAHAVFVERRDKAVRFLLARCERDDEAAYQAALQIPDVQRAAEVCESFQYVLATDPVAGVRQLLTIQLQLVEEARKLAAR